MLGCLFLCITLLVQSTWAGKFDDINPAIDWIQLSDLDKVDYTTNSKPIMYLLTQPWCGACKRLKSTFLEEGLPKSSMEMLSKQYIMVSVDGDDNNKLGEEFSPDGGYIPRVLFAKPDGTLRTDITNPAAPAQYKYFYTSAAQVATALESNLPLLAAPRNGAHDEM